MIPPAHAPAFLAAHGWAGAEIRPLAGDASFRRYFRVVDADRTAVLMDAPPEHEDMGPFLAIADHLATLGLSSPQNYGVDRAGGLLLLEDFGDDLVGPLLRAGKGDETRIYRDAVTLLARLAEQPVPATLPPYDMAVLRREIGLFPEWYAPALGLDVDRDGWARAWEAVLPRVADRRPPVLVLRDYHVDNIVLLDREGLRRLGLLDFQDALAGHPAYDLVSLLQDARRDVSPELEAEMLAAYAAEAGIADMDVFRADYEILGAQRNTKILGIFTRLWKRDGKRTYLAHQPRVWGYLERNLRHPALAPVAAWFAANVPAEARAAYWAGEPA
ncbi:aminoglycoside phosphotransferase family protein [Sphingomonas abietis]|uniref:Phosphotransferase n=1 Tax=Sphingomonas abietis TaxID=3012344 RepID=A0ABY7NIV2_9SPHN|nr:phosphotransferase [Sphingomonas abietis]WBO21409.1 phosphotransferase [Sphingomonas abietis]